MEDTSDVRALTVTVPRSGTHLLDSVLERMPGWRRRQKIGLNAKLRHHPLNRLPGGERVVAGIGRPHPVRTSTVRARLRTIGDHEYGMAQLPYSPAIARLVDDVGLRLIAPVRDPRDVIVSQYLLARDDSRHVLHRAVSGLSERDGIRVLLSCHTDRRGRTKVGIGEQLAAFAGWLTHPSALVVRFEDLVGPRGGGTLADQADTIAAVARHLDVELDDDEVAAVGEDMFGAGKTFRRGLAGGWRDHFDPAIEQELVDVAGPLLERYGYPSPLSHS